MTEKNPGKVRWINNLTLVSLILSGWCSVCVAIQLWVGMEALPEQLAEDEAMELARPLLAENAPNMDWRELRLWQSSFYLEKKTEKKKTFSKNGNIFGSLKVLRPDKLHPKLSVKSSNNRKGIKAKHTSSHTRRWVFYMPVSSAVFTIWKTTTIKQLRAPFPKLLPKSSSETTHPTATF